MSNLDQQDTFSSRVDLQLHLHRHIAHTDLMGLKLTIVSLAAHQILQFDWMGLAHLFHHYLYCPQRHPTVNLDSQDAPHRPIEWRVMHLIRNKVMVER